MYNISPLNHTMIFNNNSTGTSAPGEMGKDEFLQMLVAQLRHQDPLSPMESQQFASQLAEFSSLEELSSIDDSVAEGVDVDMLLTQAINNTLATTLIGKEVIAFGDSVHLNGSDETDLSFKLSNAAENVEISIYDEQGTVVRTMSLKAMGSGDHTIPWNGENDQGEDLPEGTYTFSVTATDADGNAIDSYTLTRGIISSVLYQDGAAVLMMNGHQIQFSDVLEIG